MIVLHVVNSGMTEKGNLLQPGEVVGYLGHIPGGNVRIRLTDSTEDTAHPLCFKELLDTKF